MLKFKMTSRLIVAAAVVTVTTLATTAQKKLERAESSGFTRRIETSTPNFRPILTLENETVFNPLGKNDRIPAMPGVLSLSKSAPSKEVVTDVPVLYGCVIASRPNADGVKHSVAMYSFSNDVFTQKNSGTKATQAQGSGARVGDNYYALRRTGTGKMYVDRFNSRTWSRAAATSVSNVGLMASDVAYDPTSDIVYGCFYNSQGNGYVFGKVDYATRVRTEIKPLDMQWNAVMADADGQIYAIDMNGDLLKVDKTSGDFTVVGNTGVVPAYQTSATIDLSTDRCFWVAMPATAVSSLYEVDLTTAVATKLYDFACNDEITGMFAEPVATPADAPAAVENLKADFTDNSLSGSVSFTAPSVTCGGESGSGTLTYKLWSNGVLRATASCSYGEDVSIPLTMDKGDKYYIVAAVSNEAGRSPISRVATFIGNDTPKAPAPVVTREDDEFVISWEKVQASVNGGYINPDQLTYTVRRYPDDVEIASGISETTVRDLVPEVYGQMIPYKYSVSATFEGNTGAAGTSDYYPLGTIVPPYIEGFDDAESINNFIIIDSNGDNVKWIYSPSMSSAYITNSNRNHDDWLMTAGMYLTAGKEYTFSYEAMASFSPERIEVKMGNAANPEAMTKTLVEPVVLEGNFTLEANPIKFTVEESGVYHIGFHAISDADSFYLYVDNISVNCEGGPAADAVDPPYIQTFDKSSVLSAFTVIDGNGDGRIWNIDRGEARVGYGDGRPMDDWLITPPVNLRKGARYNIRLDARCANEGPIEKFEIRLGTANTIEAMETEIMPETSVMSVEYAKYEQFITVPEDNAYFIGIHGCSDPGSYMLYVDNLEVAAPVFDNAPGQATEGHAEGAEFGELSATVTFKAPSVNVVGDPLESLTEVVVKRDGSVVATFENPSPGAQLSFTDNVPEMGDYIWTVIGYNELGAGVPYEITGYVGVGIPVAPTDVKFTEEGNTGKITLTWTAPVKDELGHSLNPDALSYMVVELINGQQLLLAKNIRTTSYTLQATGSGTQAFKTYGVFPVTEAGTGRGTPSDSRPVGTPDPAPWYESAPGGVLSKLVGTALLQPDAQWQLANDGTLGMNSFDGDNGFFMMQGNNTDAAAGIITGKIDLSNMTQPALSFYTYNIQGDYPDVNMFVIDVAADGGDYQNIATYTIDRICPEYGWNLVRADLSQYAGKTVVIRIAAVTKGYIYTFVDALSVDEAEAIDMEAAGIYAPREIKSGVEFPINIKVRNIGINPVDTYEVSLYVNDEKVASEVRESTDPMQIDEFSFNYMFKSIDRTGPHDLHAVVNANSDAVMENNETAVVIIEHKESGLPEITGLSAAFDSQEDEISLSWNSPVWNETGTTLESFENAEAFAIDEYEGWTFVDQDKSNTYGFEGIGIPNANTPKAYIVFDSAYEAFDNEEFKAHSGDKYLASMGAVSGLNDDWAISPELSGETQTVSFFAKTFTDRYGLESFEFLISSAGKEIEDFVKIGESAGVPSEWTEYGFEIPEGTRYFAIRCTSADRFIMFVDDVTFRSALDKYGPELRGFHVYREGISLTENPLTETAYADCGIQWEEGKTLEYAVSAVFAQGESKASRILVTTSGVGDIASDNLIVYAVKGAIVIEGAEGMSVSVASVDARTIFNGKAENLLHISVEPGVYAVKVGKFAARIKVD